MDFKGRERERKSEGCQHLVVPVLLELLVELVVVEIGDCCTRVNGVGL
jgi:hypothetical protein